MCLLQSGAVYMEMEFGEWFNGMSKWSSRWSVYHVSQNIVSVRCQAIVDGDANSVGLSIFIVGH